MYGCLVCSRVPNDFYDRRCGITACSLHYPKIANYLHNKKNVPVEKRHDHVM